MNFFILDLTLVLCLTSIVLADKPSWNPFNLPLTTESGQTGTNQCNSTADLPSSQSSMCQTAYLNSLEDFCLWAPPNPNSDIGQTEEEEVAWCTAPGRGTRVIPPGAIQGAHFLKTSAYVQITGQLNGPSLNIMRGDAGGELDPHGATGNGNPVGSLIFTTAFGGGVKQVMEWMNFMSDGEFCIRICNPDDPNAPLNCQHIYDTMGCDWVMPGDYTSGSFDTCLGDPIAPPGVYGQSTFHQGDPNTPPPHAAGASSQCTAEPTIVPSLVGVANVSVSASSNATSSVARPVATPTATSIFSTLSASVTASSQATGPAASVTTSSMRELFVLTLIAAGSLGLAAVGLI